MVYKYNLTRHAKDRMIRCGYTLNEIHQTVHYGVKLLQHNNTIKAIKGNLRLIFRKPFKDKIVVITVLDYEMPYV